MVFDMVFLLIVFFLGTLHLGSTGKVFAGDKPRRYIMFL